MFVCSFCSSELSWYRRNSPWCVRTCIRSMAMISVQDPKLNNKLKSMFFIVLCQAVDGMWAVKVNDTTEGVLAKWSISLEAVHRAGFKIQFAIDALRKVVSSWGTTTMFLWASFSAFRWVPAMFHSMSYGYEVVWNKGRYVHGPVWEARFASPINPFGSVIRNVLNPKPLTISDCNNFRLCSCSFTVQLKWNIVYAVSCMRTLFWAFLVMSQ